MTRRVGLNLNLTWKGLAVATAILAILATTGCGGESPTSPTPPPTGPVIQSVTPATGSSFGGTVVTILGTGFVTGAAVTIGGSSASAVTVESGQKITAMTPAHASGTASVVVSGSTGSNTLASGFTFVAPGVTNNPPVVKSITAQGRRLNEPAGFADLNEVIDVSAAVEDTDTAADKLEYSWSSDVGTFSGTGSRVTWKAPSASSRATPVIVTLTLRVTERYQGADASGLPVEKTNVADATSSLSLHDSENEVSTMAYNFLVAFSHSEISTDQVVRDFTPSCEGTAAETKDVAKQRTERQMLSYAIGNPVVSVNFGGKCPFRSVSGDACAIVPVEWHSRVLVTTDSHYNWTDNTAGFDQVASVYLNGRWWLCQSDYDMRSQSFVK